MANDNEIGKISALLERISSDVYGNGREGLIKSITRMEEKVDNLSSSVTYHTHVISNFIEFQAKYDGNVCGMIITIDGTNVNRRPVLKGCHFIGGNGTAMDAAPVIWTGKVQDGLIADNYFHEGTIVQINIATASSSGLIVNNSFGEDDLSTTFIVQNGMKVVAAQDVTTPTGSP